MSAFLILFYPFWIAYGLLLVIVQTLLPLAPIAMPLLFLLLLVLAFPR